VRSKHRPYAAHETLSLKAAEGTDHHSLIRAKPLRKKRVRSRNQGKVLLKIVEETPIQDAQAEVIDSRCVCTAHASHLPG
jgi:hypothetical protein